MDEQTTIAQGLRATDDSAGYDAACKRVLSEKAILARIMKACLDEYKDCDADEIGSKYIEGQPQVSDVPVLPDEEGTVTYDTDCIQTGKSDLTGRKIVTKETQEGCLSFSINRFSELPRSSENLRRLAKRLFRQSALLMTFASGPRFPTPESGSALSLTWRPRTIFTPATR